MEFQRKQHTRMHRGCTYFISGGENGQNPPIVEVTTRNFSKSCSTVITCKILVNFDVLYIPGLLYLFVADARERGYATQPTSMYLRTPNLKDGIRLLRDHTVPFHSAFMVLPWRFRFQPIFLVRACKYYCTSTNDRTS